MRAIDGDALKRKAQKVATEAWKMKLTAKIETTLNQFIDWIDAQPTVHPEPQWIPVTEEPKESGKYLVTAVIGFIPDHVDDPNTYVAVTTANYLADIRGSIKWYGNNVEKVLAWMPVPEVYKPSVADKCLWEKCYEQKTH